MTSKHTDYTGKILDKRYRVVKRLAEGGMGSVYIGQHVSVGRKVAIKFLHEDFAEKDDIVLRFFREAQAAAAIRHKNIIDVWDMGTSDQGDPYLVMEYLEGESLADLLKRTGPLDLPAACAVMESVLFALGAAHEKGIIHRDLKPDNIFLAWIPGEAMPVIKLIDFGVSKLSSSGQSKVTVAGTQFGTPAYMAPEQIRGEESLDLRADLYSMGVVFYRMLTGRLPFQGPNNLAVFANALSSDPLPLKEAYKDAPLEASSVVMRLLSKNAMDRPASAAALLEELKALPGYGERLEQLVRYTSQLSEKTFAGGDLGEPNAEDSAGTVPSKPHNSFLLRTTPTGWAKNTTQSGKKGTGFLIGAAAAVLLGIGVTVGFIVRPTSDSAGIAPSAATNSSPKESTDKSSAKSTDDASKPIAEIPAKIAPAATTSKSPTESTDNPPPFKTVNLKINGAPKDAAFFFNDERYDSALFSVQRSDKAATVKVTAEGYEDFTIQITPDADQPIEVHLKSTAPAVLEDKRPTKPSRTEADKETPSKKAESTKREKPKTSAAEIIKDGKIKRTESFDD